MASSDPRTLQQALAQPADADLAWLLELADSSITYRSRYMARPQWLAVLDLLALDESNPRALAFQVKGIADYLERLTKALGPCGGDAFEIGRAHV